MTDPISNERLVEMLAGLEGVTPGPWFQTGAPWFRSGDGVLAGSPDGNIAFLIADTDDFAGGREEYQGFPLGDKERDAAHISRCDPDTIRSLIEEVQASRRQSPAGVDIKPLEWMDADEGMCTKWRAAALGGHYELVDFGKDDPGFAVNFHWGRPLSFWFIQGEPDERGPTGPKIFPTLKAAKAAAQADYERRVLSCLSVEPAGVEGSRNV